MMKRAKKQLKKLVNNVLHQKTNSTTLLQNSETHQQLPFRTEISTALGMHSSYARILRTHFEQFKTSTAPVRNWVRGVHRLRAYDFFLSHSLGYLATILDDRRVA